MNMIPRGYKSETVNGRMTDNVMAELKRTERQTMINRKLHRKIKIEQHGPHNSHRG